MSSSLFNFVLCYESFYAQLILPLSAQLFSKACNAFPVVKVLYCHLKASGML